MKGNFITLLQGLNELTWNGSTAVHTKENSILSEEKKHIKARYQRFSRVKIPGKMNTQFKKKNHVLYVPESAEVTKFAFESADMHLLELSHKEYSVPMLSIFKEIEYDTERGGTMKIGLTQTSLCNLLK